MTDNTELKRLAEAAPEGPWFGPEYAPGTSYVFDVDLGTLLHYESIDTEQDACLRYVAAANPAVVLALITENENLVAWREGLLKERAAHIRQRDQFKAENEELREANDKFSRRNGMLEENVQAMTETHVLYTWLRKKVDQPGNDFVAVQMNIGHDWVPVHDLDRDLRSMIEREEP